MLEELYDRYYTEEHFSVSNNGTHEVVLRSVTQFLTLIVGAWSVWLIPTVFALAAEQWQWQLINNGLKCLLLSVGLFALHVTITFMPRRIVITPGSKTFIYYWGLYPVAFRSIMSTDQIKGIYVSTQRYGKGTSVPHLAIVLRSRGRGFLFARYPENDVAIERAHYLSGLTGLPVLTVGLKEAVRRRKL